MTTTKRFTTTASALMLSLMGTSAHADLAQNLLRLSVTRSCNGCDLRGADFSVIASLEGADLSGADLRDVYLADANLTSAKPDAADLSGADLSGSNLTKASFERANLAGANLSEATIGGTDFRYANLEGASLRGVKIDRERGAANFQLANLRRADFSAIRGINGARSEQDCCSADAFFDSSDLTSANFNGADLKISMSRPGGPRYEPIFINTDFSGANLSFSIFYSANMEGAKFSGTDLRRARFYDVNLTNADLKKARLAGATIIGDLTGADLRNTDLKTVDFSEVVLCKTNAPWGIDNTGCK